MYLASTCTNKQGNSEYYEPETSIGKGTLNQKIDRNEIFKIIDTQTTDKDNSTNKSVNRNNLSPNIQQQNSQVQMK